MDQGTVDIKKIKAQKPDESQDGHTEIVTFNLCLEGIQ